MRVLCFFILFISPWFSDMHAQPTIEVDVEVGDTVEIKSCPAPYFKHLDLFRKTRWVGNEPAYDTATGDGFYKSFFSTGDFNAEELSADFSGKKFAIMGMEVLNNKNTGEPMYVLYLQGPLPNSIIWVDFYEALDENEITVHPLDISSN